MCLEKRGRMPTLERESIYLILSEVFLPHTKNGAFICCTDKKVLKFIKTVTKIYSATFCSYF